MTFLNNFFNRKKALKVVTPNAGELEELQTAIAMHRGRLSALEAEEASLTAELAEVERLGSTLKIALSEGSPSATPALDGLASKKIAIERRREGLGLRIATLRAELTPLNARAGQLARERDRQRQDDLVADAEKRAEEQFDRLAALWLQTCAAAYEWQVTLCGPAPGGLDSEHAAVFGQIRNRADVQLQQLRLSLVNDQWHMREPGRFDLKIVPAIPVRPREVAKVG